MAEVTKGARVIASWYETHKFGVASLAGVQPKVSANKHVVEGVVMHIRGDHPVEPTTIGVWIETDDGEEIVVDSKHIIAVVG